MDDVISAVDYLKTLPYVDPARLGIMGWSHGGYITLLSVFRNTTPFKASAAMVPVTNLVFRLSFKGPRYRHSFSTQERIRGLPFEEAGSLHRTVAALPRGQSCRRRCSCTSPPTTPTSTSSRISKSWTRSGRASRTWPRRRSTWIRRQDRRAAATFNRRVNMKTLERDDSPEQRDSWNRTWTFFEWHLRAVPREAGAIDVERVEVKAVLSAAAVVLACLSASGQDSLRQLPSRAVLIVGGTLIDGTGAPPRRGAS